MRKRIAGACLAAALALSACSLGASTASADFGIKEVGVGFTAADGSAAIQAGSHPYAQTARIGFNTRPNPDIGFDVPDGDLKDLTVSLPPGFVGDPNVVPTCSSLQFDSQKCPASSQVGVNDVEAFAPGDIERVPVYSLDPPPGVAMRLGFQVITTRVTIDLQINPNPPYNVLATTLNTPNPIPLYGSELTVWGVPGAAAHDPERRGPGCEGGCSVNLAEEPLLTLPRSCEGPLETSFTATPWLPALAAPSTATALSEGMIGCEKLAFKPTIAAVPTSKAASSPTGLDFSLNVNDQGLKNPDGLANSDIRKTVVTLPEGFTVNPSIAEGLEVCAPAQVARETAFSAPGDGCPDASKIGSVEVETPLLDEQLNGALYQAAPYDNPFGSLIALYVVIKNPNLGIKVTQPLEVRADPATGQLTTIAEDMPQLPFSAFRLHFREGTRSPLATPPGCGTHTVKAVLYPWSGAAPLSTTSEFQVITGPGAGPCPTGGLPPFNPGLVAGTLNNAAGSFSPFNLRLSRTDSEQEFTRFSIKLPPGLSGKLAGIPYCPEAAIAAAKARTGPNGGLEEILSPSCPAASEIGTTLAGSGVGPSLAYAPGKIYLAGPYNGSNLSMVAITAAKVGPFDLGTVVIRQAFKIDPRTAEVFIDSVGSDPLPHIIQGIPVHLRDIRAYVDRPGFVLNPTDCTRTSTASTLLGSGLDFGSAADDRPVTVSTPFQAADCAALPFKPRLALRLKGGSRRGATPRLIATLRMNGIGEAGIQRAQVTLPRSEFLEQAHIRTLCTRVQFEAGPGHGAECPPASVYGTAKATTPILDQPLVGPVFLRSNGGERELPDLVAALGNDQVEIELVGYIDSSKGRIRNTFEATPDAPISTFTLSMQGGKKGLLANSTNICKGTNRALASFEGQNGKVRDFRPVVKADCRKGKAKAKAKRGAR